MPWGIPGKGAIGCLKAPWVGYCVPPRAMDGGGLDLNAKFMRSESDQYPTSSTLGSNASGAAAKPAASADANDGSVGSRGALPAGGGQGVMLTLLFIISMVTITLQVVQVRIFSYTMNHAFVYMAISLAMVGFGLSGTVISVVPSLRRINPRNGVAGCLALFALTVLLTHMLFARVSDGILPEQGVSVFSITALALISFALPYFFAGTGVALALLSNTSNVGRTYFINLIGSAAGCFAVYPFLPRLGAEGTVIGICAVSALASALGSRARWRALSGALFVALAACMYVPEQVLPFEPDASDQLRAVEAKIEQVTGEPVVAERGFAVWDPVGKIEIFRFPEPFNLFGTEADSLFFTQDAGAGSVLLGVPGHPEMERALARGTLYGLGTRLRPNAEALIIGLGGGPDLLAALANGAKSVVGVEINRGTLAVLQDEYDEFLGLADKSDRLEFVHADGRGYVRRIENRFDVLQMTGADTYAASASSGSMLAENYLYTIEAFGEYLRAVKSDGLIAITRFSHEANKVVTTMVEALKRAGVSNPERHIAVVVQGRKWRSVITKRSPFTQAELDELDSICAESVQLGPLCTIPAYTPLGFGFDSPMTVVYKPQLAGSNVAALDSAQIGGYDVTPATDDKPFFFNFKDFREVSIGDLFSKESLDKHQFDLADYLVIVVQIGLISLLLILGPLVFFKLGGQSLSSGGPLLLYFSGIGIGFMFLEIVLMQKCGLFLGHPNYSISTVLFSLLVFSGLGSFFSNFWGASPSRKIALALCGIAIWAMAFAAFSQGLFSQFLHLPIAARIALLVSVIAPLGFCAGMPFPTCLSVVDKRLPHFSPWAMGANGFASVIASLAAIPLSMIVGFSQTLWFAVGAYAMAGIGYALFQRRST